MTFTPRPPAPPIEDRLPHFVPGQIASEDIWRMRLAWQDHYRALTGDLMDSHTRLIHLKDPGNALAALEYAKTRLATLTTIVGLMYDQEQIEAEEKRAA